MDDNKNEEIVSLLMKNVTEFGRFSFELEERREQSLITQSGHLLTALSILSAALLMALPILIEHIVVPKQQILTSAGIVFLPMLISAVLCVLAQWRYGYQTMMNAAELQGKIQTDISSYPTQAQYDFQWIDQLTEIQKSKKKNNDHRVRLIKAAVISVITAVGLLMFAWLLFIVLYV